MSKQTLSTQADDRTRLDRSPSTFVARQTILTTNKRVFGYELLFRDGVENYFRSFDPEAASQSTLDSTILMGVDLLCDGHLAFINCTREFLLKDYITLLPSSQTVVEVLENVPADEVVVAACQRLKESGYAIALDDFTADDPRGALTGLADIIKVDFRACSAEQCAAIVERYGKHSQLLAEKVETQEEFASAQKLGFSYFQGYFFHKPEVLSASQIPTNQLNYVRILQAASRSVLDPSEIESLIKTEPSLCYRLLRYLNSSQFGFSSDIQSIRHALTMLGQRETRRWVRLVATLAAGQNTTSDLVLSALVRARFCELLGPKTLLGESDLFLMGILSLMDAILQMPMDKVLEGVPLALEYKAVLLGQPSKILPIYNLMLAQESGQWNIVKELVTQLNLSQIEVQEDYWRALQWSRDITGK
jgi:EAL and modified HD-GYP domain-containing signal transduction protein